MHPLRKLRESGPHSASQVGPLLAENVVFHSPALVRAVEGRKRTAEVLAVSPNVRKGKYVSEYRLDDRTTFLRWTGEIKGHEIESLEILVDNEVLHDVGTLGKPTSRQYVTHHHPDHLLGAVVFETPIYALAEVKAKIEAVGDRVAAEEHEKRGDIIASHAERHSAPAPLLGAHRGALFPLAKFPLAAPLARW